MSTTDQRVVVLTGASSGIGRVAARALADGGALVACVGRDRSRTEAIAREVGGPAFVADFDRLDEVRDLAQELRTSLPRIDVLANNAGGLVSHRAVTRDGFERTLQSNHLAPFLLARLLLDRLVESGGRLVATSSTANVFGRVRLDDLDWAKRPWLGGWGAYGTSKLLTNLVIRQFAARAPVKAFAFHPGLVVTSFGSGSRAMQVANAVTGGHYGIPPEEGAVPLIQLAGPTTIGVASGTYLDRLKPGGLESPQARDEVLAAAVWDVTSKRVGLPSEV